MRTLVSLIPFEITAALVAVLISAFTLGAVFGFSTVMERFALKHAPQVTSTHLKESVFADTALIGQGHHLFLQNCAHCHADDATGDEGPDLHGAKKTDARITAIIQKGIKGEMPKFGQKFKEDDVRALIAFIRSLDSNGKIP